MAGNTTVTEREAPERSGPGRVIRKERNLPFVDAPPLAPASDTGWRQYAAVAAGLALSLGLASAAWLAFGGANLVQPSAVAAAFAAGMLSAGIPAMMAFRRERAAAEGREQALRNRVETLDDNLWELRESEELHRGIAEAMGDLVLHRDMFGRVIAANPAMCGFFGLDGDAVKGKPFEPSVLEATLPETPDAAREIEVETPSGPRWLLWIDTPVRVGGIDGATIRSVARDITDQKRAEAAQQAARLRAEQDSRAKSRFLATASHEMRTPLNGILGMSDLLADTELTPEQAAYAAAIGGSGRALLALIEDMLDITLIEAGRFVPRTEAFSPRQLAEEVCELMSGRAHAKGIELACLVAPGVPAEAVSDPGRLRQVLLNLVGNAIKFTEKGGVAVRVEALVDPADGMRLAFSIRDTGPGMSQCDLARVFGEFEQADNAATRRHGGAGLGLSISQGIVRNLGGVISAESAEGEGSCFRFELPVTGARPDNAATPLSGQRILVVSSGAVEAKLLAEAAGGLGGEATHARTLGEAARLLAGPAGYDALVLDPAISRDPVRSLARLLGRARKRPFCAVLLRPADRSRLPAMLQAGFDAWLIRPVRQASLAHVLGERRAEKLETAAPARKALVAEGEVLPRVEVLLAEDNPVNALLARSALERAGQSPALAGDGKQALSLFRQRARAGRPFGLVLMDIHMPVMDGLSAIRAIRRFERREGLPPARILTLSADEQDQARKESFASGSDGFLTKPIAPAELIGAIRDMTKLSGESVTGLS